MYYIYLYMCMSMLYYFIYDYEEMESGGCDGGLPEDQMNRQEEAPGEFTEPKVSYTNLSFLLFQSHSS